MRPMYDPTVGFNLHPTCANGTDWHDHYRAVDTPCPQCLALFQRDIAQAIATALYEVVINPDDAFYCRDCAVRSYRRMMGMDPND